MKQIFSILLIAGLMAGCDSDTPSNTPDTGVRADVGGGFWPSTDGGEPTDAAVDAASGPIDAALMEDVGTPIPTTEITATGGINIIHGNIETAQALPVPLNENVSIQAVGLPTLPADGFVVPRAATGTVYGYATMGIANAPKPDHTRERFDRGYFTLVNQEGGGYTFDISFSMCPHPTPITDIVINPAETVLTMDQFDRDYASERTQLDRFYRRCVARDVLTFRVATANRRVFSVTSNVFVTGPSPMATLTGMFGLQPQAGSPQNLVLSGALNSATGSSFRFPSGGVAFTLPTPGEGDPAPNAYDVAAPAAGTVSVAYPLPASGTGNATFAVAEGAQLAHPAGIPQEDRTISYNLSTLLPNEVQYFIGVASGYYRVLAQSTTLGATPGYRSR